MANNGGLLTRSQILGAKDVPTQDVEVPEWGGVVRVRRLSRAEQIDLASRVYGEGVDLLSVQDGTARIDLRRAGLYQAYAVFLAAVDRNGQRMFTEEADVEQLAIRSDDALGRVFDVIQELSGLNIDAEVEAKKSAAPPAKSSSSASV